MEMDPAFSDSGSASSRPVRARRSCLAVPGSSRKMQTKAAGLDADQVFLDLEDAVAAPAKAAARGEVVDALRQLDWGTKTRAVRINDVSTPWALRDLLEVVGGAIGHLDAIVVPKVADAGQVAFVDHVITQLEREAEATVGTIGLEIQIEDADGLVNIREILAASSRVEAVILGPGDMAAALGMPSLTVGAEDDNYPGDHWHHILTTLLIHARHRGVQVIDGPYVRIHDLDGFGASARKSRALGYDGKWALHPVQIDLANEIFGVPQAVFERACDIVDAYQAATASMTGAVMFGDEMIDEASRKMAMATLARGQAQGRKARPVPADVAFHDRASWREQRL
ncbi:MAG: CoA ester lyase [Nitriliruptoraceae bacterium]